MFALVLASLAGTARARADTIINNSTLAYYNSGIGSVLNDTDPFFSGDPTLSISMPPDISAAATQLGGWLNNPPDLKTPGATWSTTPVPIPTGWAVGTTTGVVYVIGSADIGLNDVSVSIGVDNGILVWLDGTFVHGNTAPGPNYGLGEYVYELGDLAPGEHYLQLLRVGLGFPENWSIEVTATAAAVPEPAASILLMTGIVAAGTACHLKQKSLYRPRSR